MRLDFEMTHAQTDGPGWLSRLPYQRWLYAMAWLDLRERDMMPTRAPLNRLETIQLIAQAGNLIAHELGRSPMFKDPSAPRKERETQTTPANDKAPTAIQLPQGAMRPRPNVPPDDPRYIPKNHPDVGVIYLMRMEGEEI